MPREKLIITCALNNPTDTVEKIRRRVRSPIPPQVLQGQSSMAHWLIGAALLDENGAIALCEEPTAAMPVDNIEEDAGSKEKAQETSFSEEEYAKIENRLNYIYPYLYAG